jgi:hypothetical protein
MSRSPFDKLRANGAGLETDQDLLFVLSVSKHERGLVLTAPEY